MSKEFLNLNRFAGFHPAYGNFLKKLTILFKCYVVCTMVNKVTVFMYFKRTCCLNKNYESSLGMTTYTLFLVVAAKKVRTIFCLQWWGGGGDVDRVHSNSYCQGGAKRTSFCDSIKLGPKQIIDL